MHGETNSPAHAALGPSERGEVLVAIMNNERDMAIARERHWYRVPVKQVEGRLRKRWPPRWLAFYQTKVFGAEAHAVRHYARVLSIHRVPRRRLFPDEPENAKSKRWYYQLKLSPLERLPQPILSRRFRRIVFIPTTWRKLIHAVEINDLYDGSPLEDRLWAMLKRVEIGAERQYYVEANRRRYALDFAVFCNEGKIDIETDGDTWHARPDRIPLDNQRQNDLTASGWHTLRFNTAQVLEGGFDETIPPIMQAVNRFGGLTSDGLIPRPFTPSQPAAAQQLTLFEAGPDYDVDV